ncbi:hypothetical protein [Aureispira sp. CCB-QB1]|uniref:hypothetical protein n=1 Tax=Aureispira sp. CCB-QB1 TaxID=1313421 RepID=UPI0006985D64|nr:hypothetical protein [Aureispira sp. CCB-QB1]
MKHIKKRFLLQMDSKAFFKENEANTKVLNLGENLPKEISRKRDEIITFLKTTEDIVIAGCLHRFQGKNLILPIPDPTLIYFHSAQSYIKGIKEARKKLIEKINFSTFLNETAINEIYDYYGKTSGFTIFLFTSIESFINQMLPDNYIYKVSSKKRTELYNKQQIQVSLDFKTKISKVLEDITGKNFFKNSTSANSMIWNLKEFRDDIIHTKQEDNNMLRYEGLIKKSLNFKYDKALISVASFMNFYKKDYIVECNCGGDF